ncbi:MAG TPA: TCP-1/cpn60 chaperonin family protein [Nitrososphaera sp.]|nr:TCP-1/cpn60 chaperonin family protein [Nitrososphaera sp.]
MTALDLFAEGVRRSNGDQSRRYNLLAARLISELVTNLLGPRGMDKIFVDIMGEVTVTKDGATLLRKIDVEHPAAKVLIEASNAVDNEVGDGTTTVVVLAGALVKKAEELLDSGISPATIVDGYTKALDIALEALAHISQQCSRSDRLVMNRLVSTCLSSKVLSFAGTKAVDVIVDAFCSISDLPNGVVELDDIKIEEKLGSMIDLELVKGIVIDKTFDSTSMQKVVEPARILLIDEDLEGKKSKTDAEIRIDSPDQIKRYAEKEAAMVRSKIDHIIDTGANVVISRKGINTFAQSILRESGIVSVRRVKENDLLWLARATGATVAGRLDHDHTHEHDHGHSHHDHDDPSYKHGDIDIKLGSAARVQETLVGGDRMIFVEGCENPKAVTLLLRAGSKQTLDECHRSVLDAINVLRDFLTNPSIVAGGGAGETAIAKVVRTRATRFEGREQIVIQKFADALEEIPLVLAKNAGMNPIDTLAGLRSKHALSNGRASTYGVDATERRIKDMLPAIVEPSLVKGQILKTAVEVVNLLVRVDDVLIAKPATHTHTHDDGTRHSHAGGDREHRHDHFDRLGKKQRPRHHYY